MRTPSDPQAITLINRGSAPLEITSIMAGANFIQKNNCASSLAPSASCMISVKFRPQVIGALTGAITINDNASGSPQTVSLSGIGTAVTLLPPSLDFGSQTVGTTSQPQTVTLTNYAPFAVNIRQVRLVGDFTDFAQTNNCGSSVPAGGSCAFTITFTPQAAGFFTGNLEVADNGGASPQIVPFSGTGTQ